MEKHVAKSCRVEYSTGPRGVIVGRHQVLSRPSSSITGAGSLSTDRGRVPDSRLVLTGMKEQNRQQPSHRKPIATQTVTVFTVLRGRQRRSQAVVRLSLELRKSE